MSQHLEHDSTREATASIRGYVYQAYQSVLAWMRLNESEVLFLEGAEDFDIHEGDTVETTQVKDRAKSGPLTLRSSEIVKAINNLWKHQELNPDKKIRLRFLTTAVPGQEKGVVFPKFEKGLEYWEHAARDDRLPITPLKDLLLNLDLEVGLKDFLKTSADRAVRERLILAIHWDTGSKPKDALIAGINDRLVVLGEKRGVDSHYSEQVLNSLLRKIADLLSSEGDRSLTYADFLRAFDEATMESMPRGEAAALRRIINQIVPSNLVVTGGNAPMTITASQVLSAPLPLVRGAANRERLVEHLGDVLRRSGALIIRGSTGVGKTSIARLVADYLGGTWAWAGFRGRDGTQIGYELRQAALELRALASPLRVVLDDLDLGMVSRFEREFLLFVFSVIDNSGFVLVTGPDACPSVVLQKLWLLEDCNQEIPYLDETDIGDVITNHGGGDTETAQWTSVIRIMTRGHPQLVHARVRNLQSKHWPPVEGKSFFQTVDLEQERDSARRRLIEEIPSEEVRSLAYRLSLLTGHFSRQIAIILANLPPVISLPGEAFETLVGPWIEKLAENTYRVSPLLQNAGDKILSVAEIQAVHEGIALGIIGLKALSPFDFGTALLHAFVGRSETGLGVLAATIIRVATEKVWKALADAVFWFSSMALESGQCLCETNPNVDVLLRIVQFKVAAAGQKVREAITIAERLIQLVDNLGSGKLATVNATVTYSTLLISYNVAIPPRQWLHMLSRLMDLRESDEDLREIWRNLEVAQQQHAPLAGLSAAQALFTVRCTSSTGLSDLDSLLDALEDLDAEKRAHLLMTFKVDPYDLADLLVGNAWWRETSQGRLDVGKGVIILRKTVGFGRQWNVPELVRAAYVAISVLYDEYSHDSDSALKVLEEGSKELDENDPKLINQRAKVMYGQQRYPEALEFFEVALADDRLSGVNRVFSSRLAGISAAQSGD